MEKHLSIIRHAKSSWAESVADHERSLNTRGNGDSKLMGKFLSAQGITFDQIYCSTARRAQQTLENLNAHLNVENKKIINDESLYLASVSTLVQFIENIPDSFNHVAIIGHNPGLTELCNYLCGDDLENLPTCAVYTIQFPSDDWRAITEGAGENVKLITAHMLKDFLSKV